MRIWFDKNKLSAQGMILTNLFFSVGDVFGRIFFLGKLFIAFISGRSEVIHNSELLLLDTQIQSINFDFNITISIMPFREPINFKTDLSF